MLQWLGKLAKRLAISRSGNATLIVAMGMPALIGGAGFAVDTAQWYMWKRELQYATDQAALAGAWSIANGSNGTEYKTRALQEISANQQIVNFAGTPSVTLSNWADGSNNSVIVSISATRALPFSSFLTGEAATISATSQAAFTAGTTYTACLLAVDPEGSKTVVIGGNASLTAGCGVAALSTADDSIVANGNPDVEAGWLISAGGIDDWFKTNTTDDVHEYVNGLSDPFAGLTPPTNSTQQTYACSKASTSSTTHVETTTTTTYKDYSGTDKNNLTLVATRDGGTSTTATDSPTKNKDTEGTSTTDTTATGTTTSTGTGNSKTYYRTDTVYHIVTTTTIATTTTAGGASLSPGTYSSIDTSCDTTMASGVYVIDGGTFSVRSQDSVIGNGVMIVLKNGASISINGGAAINLTAMTASQLIGAGLSAEQATQLAGMLVFEDPNGPGNQTGKPNKINGNSDTTLNGIVYLPKSDLTFAGTATVTSRCLMLASWTITLEGTADMSTFCPPTSTGSDSTVVATTTTSVKLVS